MKEEFFIRMHSKATIGDTISIGEYTMEIYNITKDVYQFGEYGDQITFKIYKS